MTKERPINREGQQEEKGLSLEQEGRLLEYVCARLEDSKREACFQCSGVAVGQGDLCVVETIKGLELARVITPVRRLRRRAPLSAPCRYR